MKNETARLLWILVSLSFFLLTITGTTILVLSASQADGLDNPVAKDFDPNLPNNGSLSDASQNQDVDSERKNSSQSGEKPLQRPLGSQFDDPLNDDSLDSNLPVNTPLINKSQKSNTATNSPVKGQYTDAQSGPIARKVTPPKRARMSRRTNSTVIKKRPLHRQPKKPLYPVYKSVKRHWVQVASFHLLSGAELAQVDLKEKGYKSYILTIEKDGKKYYRLRIGPFESQNEADYYLNKVKKYSDYSDSFAIQTISKEQVR